MEVDGAVERGAAAEEGGETAAVARAPTVTAAPWVLAAKRKREAEEKHERLEAKRLEIDPTIVFRRGGPKREGGDAWDSEGNEKLRATFAKKMKNLRTLMGHAHRAVGRNLSVGVWEKTGPFGGRCRMLLYKGKYWSHFGTQCGPELILSPEETLFLAEADRLLVLPHERSGDPLALADVWTLALRTGLTQEWYQAYSHLRRCSFIVQRCFRPWHVLRGESDKPRTSAGADGGKAQEMSVQEGEVAGAGVGSRVRGWWPAARVESHPWLTVGRSMTRCRDLELSFDVYAPNTVFKRKEPDPPIFRLCISTDAPPNAAELAALERKSEGVPVKVALIANGVVMIFTMNRRV